MADVYREVLRLAGNIEDPYLRAVTYARVGYYMHLAKNPLYKEAFSRALSSVAKIENPVLLVKALLEVGTFFSKTGSKAAEKIFHQAYESSLKFPSPLKDELLEELVLRLIELGKADEALFYATEISDPVKKSDVLLKLLNVYLHEGKIRKARVILESLDEEPWHSIAAFNILKEHLRREEFGSAIKVLSELKSEYWLGEAMRAIAFHLKKAQVPEGTYEKFVDVALQMAPQVSLEALKSLLIGLALQGEIKFVREVLDKLSPESKAPILEAISLSILDRPDLLKEFIGSLSGEELEEVLRLVMDSLLERSAKEDYLDVVRLVGERTRNERTLVKVVRYLSKLHAYNDAWRFASAIRDPYLRSLAFGSIAVEKLKEDDIDGAIDASLEVKDPRWGSWLLSEILAKVLEAQAGEGVREDIEERAEAQRRLWERS